MLTHDCSACDSSVEHEPANGAHTWANIDSMTQTYTFTATMGFSNLPEMKESMDVELDWV